MYYVLFLYACTSIHKKEREENEIKTKRKKKEGNQNTREKQEKTEEKKQNGNTSSKIKGDVKRKWVKGEKEPTEKSMKGQVFSHRRPYEKTMT